ncbi:MAG TPA: autotransporter-associated beta strand repeat-containing protein [Phycisphaerae bacterium]|nr:autotransporter-associated beta strand repeat-containing protein [Phycisphaerae bacterium]
MVDASGHVATYNGYTSWTSGTIQGTGSNNFPVTANLQNTTGANLNVATDGAGITVDINTLELNNVVNNQAIAVGTGNTLRFGASGGILVNTNSTVTMYMGETGATQHNVGTITAGGAPNTPGTFYLTVNSNSESAGAFRIGSILADNGTGKLTFVKAGAGNVKIDGLNTYTGDTYILQGRVQMTGNENGGTANPGAFGTGTVHVYPGAYVFPSGVGAGPITNNFDLAGIGTNAEPIGAIRMGNGLIVSGNISLSGDARVGGGNGGATALTGVITGNFNFDLGAGSSVASNFSISNPGNAWTGNTTIVARTGATAGNTIIHLGASEVIPNGFARGNLIFGISGDTVSTMTLDLNGFNETVNGVLTGTGATAANGFIENDAATTAATLTLGDNDQTAAFGGIIQNGTAAVAITKIGKGIQTLSGANTYSGDTNINAGTLSVTGSLSSSGTVKVNSSVSSAGTFAGTGTVGNVVLAADNGANVAVISPGANPGDISNLTVGSLAVNGGRLDLDLGNGGTSDKIVSTGPVNFIAASLLNPSAGALAGSYTVLTAPSITYTVAPTLAPPRNTRLSFSDILSATSIVINVTGQVANLTWTGAADHTSWDLRNTPNWTSTAPTNPNIFFFGDNVTFDDSTSSINQNVTLNTVMLSGNMVVNSTTNNYTFSGAGGIGGGGSLTKNGSSILTLNTPNSYSGGTFFNAGTLNINSNTALGSGTISFAGGTINNTSGANVSLTTGNSQNWSADINFTGTGNLGLGNGNVTLLGGSRTVTVGANTLTVGGPIGDAGLNLGLTKAGAGTLALNGNSTYGGNTSISVGTVLIGSTSAFGTNAASVVDIASGATLDVGGFAAANAAGGIVQNVTVSGTGVGGLGAIMNSSNLAQQNVFRNISLTGDATFGGTGRFDLRSASANATLSNLNLNSHTLTKIGTGQFSIVDANVSAGNISVTGGTLSLEATTTIGASTNISFGNGTVAQVFALGNVGGSVTAPISISGNVTMGNADNANNATLASNISLGSSAVLNFGPVNAGAGNGNLALTGIITQTDGSNPASVLVSTTGVVTLSGSNSYSGGTTFNAGTVNFNSLGNFGSGNLTFAGGTIQYNGNTDDVSTRTVTINAGGMGVDTTSAAGTVVFANSIGNNGNGGIIKNGSGQLTLSGANTFTGNTTINNGTLLIGNSSALAPNGALAVNSNSTAGTAGILDLNGFSLTVGPLSGTSIIQDSGGGSGSITFTINTANGVATAYSGGLFQGSKTLSLVVNGTGTLGMTGGSNYSGGTTINTGATLQVASYAAIGTSGTLTVNNGTFEILTAFGNTVELRPTALTGANCTLMTDAGVVYGNAGAITGGGTLNKTGPGIAALTGATSYTGGTNIKAGALFVNTSLSTTGTVSVNTSNTTAGTLSGTGSMGPISIAAANGANVAVIAPGSTNAAGNIGTLTGTQLTVAGGNFQYDVGNGAADGIVVTGSASFSAASAFSIVPTTNVSTGLYTLLQTTSLTLGVMPAFTLVEATGNIAFSPGASGSASFGRSTFTIDLSNPNLIRLNVFAPGAANLSWTGAVNTTWDVSNANGSVTGTANWNGGPNNTFVQLDNTTFSDAASNSNITINTQVIPGSMTFTNASKTYNLTGTGNIAGATSVLLNGAGVVAIGTANTYTGGTTVNAGTLAINNSNALGNGTLTLNSGASLDNTSAANVTLANVNSILWNGDFTFTGTGNLSLGNATVSMNGTRTVNVAAKILTVAGTISDSGSGFGIIKTGNGTLAINSTNTYAGQTNINAGVILVGSLSALGNNTLGVNINSGGTLDLGNISAANAAAGTISTNPVTIAGNGASTTLIPAGEGALVNNGANNQQNAFQHIVLAADASVGGTTRFDIRLAQANGTNAATLDLAGHTLTKNGSNQLSVVATDISSGNIVVNAGASLNANGTLASTNVLSLESTSSTGGPQGPNTPNLNGTITLNTGANMAFFQNPGLAASTAANAANSALEISAITWPITMNGNNTLGNGGGTVAIIDSNATLNGNITFEAITGALPSLTANDPIRWAGTLSGTGGVTKLGAASLVLLSNANAYSGGTAIDGGILQFSNLSQLGSGNISFAGGTLQYNGNTDDISTRNITIFGASTSNINGQSNISLAGGATIDTNGSNVTFSQPITNGGTGSFTKAGNGTLTLAANYTTASPTIVSGGTLILNGSTNTAAGISGTGALTVGTGNTAAPGLTSDGISGGIALTVNGAAKIRSNGTVTGTSFLTALTFAGANNTLDINNNKLILEPSAASHATALAALQAQVAAGQILTTGIPANFGIAVMENSATLFTSFGGIAVDSNSLLVSQELKGDANADGHVDLTDLSTVLNNFGVATSLWTKGNFDGAATIDLTDLSAVLNNFGLNNPNASFAPGVAFSSSVAVATNGAPEPTSLAVLVSGAALLLTRRRGSRKP